MTEQTGVSFRCRNGEEAGRRYILESLGGGVVLFDYDNDGELLNLVRQRTTREHTYQSDAWDVFHTNTIDVIAEDVQVNDRTLMRRGDELFCMRHLDLIGVLDLNTERIVWHWGPGELDYPHQPSLLDGGRLLVFDNGTHRGRSRVIEVDLETQSVVRQIDEADARPFFSTTRGSAQRLPNGNTLIVSSEEGRVFEVTPDNTTVWDFYSFPSRTDGTQRELLYRLPRLFGDYPRLRDK